MTKFLLRRLGYLVSLVVIAASLAYLLAASQLNPRSRFEGRSQPPPPESIDALLYSINANDKTPLITRFGRWAAGIAHGNLGLTIEEKSVNEEISSRMMVSVRLLLIGALLGSLFGVAGGAYAAIKQHKLFDHVLTVFSFVILSTPVVVLAVLVKYGGIGVNRVFGLTVPRLYTAGEYTPGIDFWSWNGIIDRVGHLILPTIVLSVIGIAFYGRYQRNAMLDVLGGDYLRTAQAKGLTRSRALVRHGLRTALIPMATLFSYQFTLLFVGATFTEKIFGWHGMGEYFVDAVTRSDVNSVAGVTLFVAILVLFAGFISDVIYAALDPRVRVQ